MRKEVIFNEENPSEITVLDRVFKKFIASEDILKIINDIASRINKDYADRKPLFLIVLKGSVFFAADLLKKISVDCEIDTIAAKSYGRNIESSGTVHLSELSENLSGKDIIIIEDIVDTGLTLQSLIEKLTEQRINSLETVSLLVKPAKLKSRVPVKYTGMEIPPDFIVGYGMDYAEAGRNLPDIYRLKA